MLCPACARGTHNEHKRRPSTETTFYARCDCLGGCESSQQDALARLVAAGVIAPPSVRRGD